SQRILNIDIGGGTTKLAVVEDGRVVTTAAVHIGGRLQGVGHMGGTYRLRPAGQRHAARAGFSWRRGDRVVPADLDVVADAMADALLAIVTPRPLSAEIGDPHLTDPIELGEVDGVMFSGGVAEYVYGREQRDFGDL